MAQWLTTHVLAKFLIASSSIPPTGNCFLSDWIGLHEIVSDWMGFGIVLQNNRWDGMGLHLDPVILVHTKAGQD